MLFDNMYTKYGSLCLALVAWTEASLLPPANIIPRQANACNVSAVTVAPYAVEFPLSINTFVPNNTVININNNINITINNAPTSIDTLTTVTSVSTVTISSGSTVNGASGAGTAAGTSSGSSATVSVAANAAGSSVGSSTGSSGTSTTAAATGVTAAASSAAAAASSAVAALTSFLLDISSATGGIKKRQSLIPYLGFFGNASETCSNAAVYELNGTRLMANGLYYSTDPGVSYQLFRPSSYVGSIDSEFYFTDVLNWNNSAFTGGQAGFCLLGGDVYVIFDGIAVPGCDPIEINVVPQLDPCAQNMTMGPPPPPPPGGMGMGPPPQFFNGSAPPPPPPGSSGAPGSPGGGGAGGAGYPAGGSPPPSISLSGSNNNSVSVTVPTNLPTYTASTNPACLTAQQGAQELLLNTTASVDLPSLLTACAVVDPGSEIALCADVLTQYFDICVANAGVGFLNCALDNSQPCPVATTSFGASILGAVATGGASLLSGLASSILAAPPPPVPSLSLSAGLGLPSIAPVVSGVGGLVPGVASVAGGVLPSVGLGGAAGAAPAGAPVPPILSVGAGLPGPSAPLTVGATANLPAVTSALGGVVGGLGHI